MNKILGYIKHHWKQMLLKVIRISFFTILFLYLFSVNFVLGLISLVLFLYLRSLISFSLPTEACLLWLGVPGSGKTTCAAWIAKHYLKDDKLRVFSNVPIAGTYKFDWKSDFGYFDMSNSIIICDEAGIYLNGRNWKNNFSDQSLEAAKKFRHDHMTLHFFSQSCDEDPIIRNLSLDTFVVEKSLLKWFVKYRVIGSKIDILDSTKRHDFIEFWRPFSRKYVFCPPAWKLFDSWDSKPLPTKDWEKW